MDDKSFRSKVEGVYLAAKEIEDYFNLLETTVSGIEEAEKALRGSNVEDY